MAPQKLTDYERKRLDNIRRNDEMMAALKLHSKATQLSKRPRFSSSSSCFFVVILIFIVFLHGCILGFQQNLTMSNQKKRSPKSKPQLLFDAPSVRGECHLWILSIPTQSPTNLPSKSNLPSKLWVLLPLTMLIVALTLIALSFNQLWEWPRKKLPILVLGYFLMLRKKRKNGSFKLGSLCLESENIARVVPGRITSVRFFPSSSVKMIVAGNKFGNIGFWGIGDSDTRDGETGVYLYKPHSAPISGILVQPNCLSKIYTTCYDGLVRLMDAEKEIFDLVFSSDECIYSLSQPKNEANCLYFGEGTGGLTIWDNRIGKCSARWVLHETRINTIDFNCENPHIVATSSSDGTACTWDLRYIDEEKQTALKTFTHVRAVQSAYFSPSGCSLATTSLDNTIRIYGGVNLEDAAVIYHENQTGRWLSTFRAIWGWDDSYLFVGNMKRGVDVVSAVERNIVMTLESPHMTAIPCRFDAHPYEVGTLAAATSGGQAYVWTSR